MPEQGKPRPPQTKYILPVFEGGKWGFEMLFQGQLETAIEVLGALKELPVAETSHIHCDGIIKVTVIVEPQDSHPVFMGLRRLFSPEIPHSALGTLLPCPCSCNGYVMWLMLLTGRLPQPGILGALEGNIGSYKLGEGWYVLQFGEQPNHEGLVRQLAMRVGVKTLLRPEATHPFPFGM